MIPVNCTHILLSAVLRSGPQFVDTTLDSWLIDESAFSTILSGQQRVEDDRTGAIALW
jgi:hypothetical protein